jgi:phage-related protein (TIGR01555 family)
MTKSKNTAKTPKAPAAEGAVVMNSMNTLIDNVSGGYFMGQVSGNQLSQTDTQYLNLREYLISNNRQLLSEMYVEHGIIQTLVDQPVSDAFSTGFDIKSSQLDADDCEAILQWCEEYRVLHSLMEAMNWTRLYGGGAIFIITDDMPHIPLKIEDLDADSNIEFRACDMWELYQFKNDDYSVIATGSNRLNDMTYTYRGFTVDPSRVMRIDGKKAPSFVRPRLRGWGMSECEKIVRPLNTYLKNQNVIFELLDEAKVDVYGIEGFNASLASTDASIRAAKRVQQANYLKSFVSALVMDKEDTYEQKQISFAGLGEMLDQVRLELATALKMPMTKLFGMSAAGFNSGEDDIENYNAMIESEIRSKCKGHVVQLLKIACQIELGFIPDDLTINFKSLRILPATEEEQVKTQQFNRIMSSWQSGLIQPEEAREGINRNSLLPVEIDENAPINEPVNGDFLATSSEKKVDA